MCTCVYDEYQWVIDIHDAFIVSPEAAPFTRKSYATRMNSIHEARESILSNYFISIGIGQESNAQWQLVKDAVTPMDSFTCRHMALK